MEKRSYCKRKIKKDYQAKNLGNPFFRKRKKEKPSKSFLGFKIFLYTTITLVLLYFFLFFSFWQIKKIEIVGTERVKPELINNLVSHQLTMGNFLFRQRNIFLFKKRATAELIKDEFNLTEIKIKKKLNNKLLIEVKERPYAFIFNESGEYYFSSIDSYLMEKIVFNEDQEVLEEEGEEGIMAEDNLTIVNVDLEEINKYFVIENKNNSSLIRSSGKINLTKDYLDFIIKLNGELSLHPELSIDRFIIADQYFKSVFVKIKEGPQIYFNVNTDINLQIDNLLLVKNNKIKDGFSKLEYIDLRYGDKIYFFPENIIN